MKEEAIKAPGSTIKQYSIMLQNRVGALTALLGLLDMHGIFCLGFSMQDCHEATIARLIVSDPERTSEIFLEKGICYTESGVLVAVLRHGPADLKKCLDALYAAEMNVNFLYPLLPCVGRGSLVALHVEDLNFGRTVLNSSGIKSCSSRTSAGRNSRFPFLPRCPVQERFLQAPQGVARFFRLDGRGKHGMVRAAWQKYP